MGSCWNCRRWNEPGTGEYHGKCNMCFGKRTTPGYLCPDYEMLRLMPDTYTKSELDAKMAQLQEDIARRFDALANGAVAHIDQFHAPKTSEPEPDSIEKVADAIQALNNGNLNAGSLEEFIVRLRALVPKKHRVEICNTLVSVGENSLGCQTRQQIDSILWLCDELGIEIEGK